MVGLVIKTPTLLALAVVRRLAPALPQAALAHRRAAHPVAVPALPPAAPRARVVQVPVVLVQAPVVLALQVWLISIVKVRLCLGSKLMRIRANAVTAIPLRAILLGAATMPVLTSIVLTETAIKNAEMTEEIA